MEPNENVAKTLFAPVLFSVGGNDPTRVMVAADYDTTLFFDGTWHSYADPIDRTLVDDREDDPDRRRLNRLTN